MPDLNDGREANERTAVGTHTIYPNTHLLEVRRMFVFLPEVRTFNPREQVILDKHGRSGAEVRLVPCKQVLLLAC